MNGLATDAPAARIIRRWQANENFGHGICLAERGNDLLVVPDENGFLLQVVDGVLRVQAVIIGMFAVGRTKEKSFKSSILAACSPFRGAVLVGAVLLTLTSAPAQNLFVSLCDYNVSNTPYGAIHEISPNGVQSIFASGLSNPRELACSSTGDLFQGD